MIGTTFYSIEKFNEIYFELKRNGNLVQQGNAPEFINLTGNFLNTTVLEVFPDVGAKHIKIT